MTCLDVTDHRPYPMVGSPWIMHMRWHDLAFLHWPVDPEVLRRFLPPGLELDTYDGRGWVGVIPFWMDNIRLRGLPAMPTVGSFAEVNLRTYVTDGKKPGVWFLSLDAHSRLGCALAKRWYRLNYRYAKIERRRDDHGGVNYASRRADGGAEFIARYRPIGEPFHAQRATLERWLCERYCLYAGGSDGLPLYRGEIHHAPWPLQRCETDIRSETLSEAMKIGLPDAAPHALFAREIDVVVWAPKRV